MSEETNLTGLRLQEAREARLLTQADVAAKVGVTRATISAYEKGLRSPSIETLNRLAFSLDLPLAYFRSERPFRESRNTPISFRRKSRASLGRLRRVERLEEWLVDIFSTFSQYLSFPAANLPFFEDDYETLDDDQIEDLAAETRTLWGMGIGPISNLIAFSEANGIVIGKADIDQDVDGASNWRGNRPFVLLNSRIQSCSRQRFSLAHEIGHIVLHRLADDSAFENLEQHKLLETQANRFAQALLFPAKAYSIEVPNLRFDYLIEVKRRWKISMQAIAMRGKSLNIFNEDQISHFYRQLSERGYSRLHEPLDDEMTIEKAVLFNEALELLNKQGEVSISNLLDDSILSLSDFSSLSGIILTEYLKSHKNNIIALNRDYFQKPSS